MPTHEQQAPVGNLGRTGNYPTLDKSAVFADEVVHFEDTRPQLRHARVAARDLRIGQTTRGHA
jgi:hypothetical protein